VIEIKNDGDGYFARQTLTSPSVYLDHWAIRKISTDRPVSERFAEALRRSSGTLALSFITQAEFAGVQFDATADSADRMLDSIAPHFFFIRAEPFEVIVREAALASGQISEDPAADDPLLQQFVELAPGPLLGKGLFKLMVKIGADLQPEMEQLGLGTLEGIARLQRRYDAEPDLRRSANKAPRGTVGIRSTLALTQVLMRRFLRDRAEKPDANDAIDLLHTIVPVSYCDYVVLDKRWGAAVNEARRTLLECGITTPLARVYSEKKEKRNRAHASRP
jgi:hypothetical protein